MVEVNLVFRSWNDGGFEKVLNNLENASYNQLLVLKDQLEDTLEDICIYIEMWKNENGVELKK